MTDSVPESLPGYMRGLNPPQLDAVRSLDGPLLVLAGAGTGKTRVLTTRIAHLLVQRKAFPGQILAVTFTNKAAAEMRGRVAAIIGETAEGMWLGTFHALAARILRRHAELAGLRSNFTILDQDDQIRLIKQLLQAEGIDDKRWPARVVHGTIERWKDRGLTPARVTADMSGEVANGRAVDIYAQYQERLKTLNAADFGDLLLHTLTIFQTEPTVLAEYHRKFKYILVDEYQDTNVAQYLWLASSSSTGNVCCVGDDDQSIYGWRGAEVDNILRFEQDFPGAKVVQDWSATTGRPAHPRSAASALIAANRGPAGQDSLDRGFKGGDKVRVRQTGSGTARPEAGWSPTRSRRRRHARRHGLKSQDMAVLVRASFQMRAFEERFVTAGRALSSRDRRSALLRARRDPRRPCLSAADPVRGRRPRLRAHRQRAQARHWRDQRP
jgi:DNA helicase II / ATP-dependent DNA helicase PcrA